jgi:flagellar hook-length control protein FliK
VSEPTSVASEPRSASKPADGEGLAEPLAPSVASMRVAPLDRVVELETAVAACGKKSSAQGAAPLQPVIEPGARAAIAERTTRAERSDATQQRTEVDDKRAEEVLRQFRNFVQPGLSTATLQLEPRELGRLSIRLALHEGRLSAHVRAERPETLRILEQHLPELRAALAAKGIEAQSFQLELGFDSRDARPSRPESRGRPEVGVAFETTLSRSGAAPSARAVSSIDTWA